MNNGKSSSGNNKSNRSGSKGAAGKKSFGSRDGAKKSYSGNDSNKKSFGSKDGAKKAYSGSDNNKKPFESKEGKKPFGANTTKKYDSKPRVKNTPKETDEIRLNKYIGNSGVCSRREADIYIVSGNVTVNGVVVTELGYRVKKTDVVNFDGTVLTPEKLTYVLLNKPKGFATINEPIVSSENVLSLLKGASKYPLAPIGRMDKTTIGLMLFTNDTNLLQKLNSTDSRSSKLYHVSLDKNLKYEDLEKVQKGVYIDERRVFVEEVSYVDDQPKTEIGIKLKASNVKLVRAIFESLGYNVIKLDRVMYGQLTKWNLPRGKWRFLTDEEVRNLKNS
ncbi:rRNA pseudouridine synthase [Myroides marinus]|uniref:pseudouridine synthase n=1 Tax=Myroides marinus TaxID=703342 RepID=UPI002574F1C1|nr:pseudouridine synthase [Myroides marinus]MDM1371840.1 rRNA pseudouridine synthase [Myroides marinus]MDM1390102.1 rRNA pseudouridine synthase [Myroides marinus]MDM1403750.1 rRNA pseudouridine synthase [Myroides marinus]MDM1502394.1 rRNA pseudouridine synthase [Myroides marinus]MDM1533188.1 rRNA pseudouridine synthase [Myroides marinus]